MQLLEVEGLIDSSLLTNLVVIGDSEYEMEAGTHFQARV